MVGRGEKSPPCNQLILFVWDLFSPNRDREVQELAQALGIWPD
jgi:hypothetical protein